jgi:hypothetical protein
LVGLNVFSINSLSPDVPHARGLQRRDAVLRLGNDPNLPPVAFPSITLMLPRLLG